MTSQTKLAPESAARTLGRWLALDKLGAIGAFLAAVAAPCCFPLFAAIASAFGMGSIPFLRDNAPVLIQTMSALALVGQIAAYRQHRRKGPLIMSAASVVLIVVAYSLSYHVVLIYGALAGLTFAAVWNLTISHQARFCCGAGRQRS